MARSIIFLGTAPEPDLDKLQKAAAFFGYSIQILASGAPHASGPEAGPPAGCISFVPCTQQAMLDMFGAMPIGFGQEIPLYQRIDGEECPAFCAAMPFAGFFRSPLTALDCRNIMMGMARSGVLARQNREITGEVMKYRKQKHQLIKIGTALSLQNDLTELLSLILAETRDFVAADAGSIYIREKSGPGGAFTGAIRFKISQNDSIDIAAKTAEFSIPIDNKSVAGYVALTGEPLSIDDVATLDDSAPYKKARKGYEDKFEYPVKSMLTVPLKNLNHEVAGVLQLMNKKTDAAGRLRTTADVAHYVAPFTLSDEDFVLSIASQAAVSIERVQLYQEIKDIFEGYLRSSIAAIDERDRVTYGHSRRVMGYAMAFADAVNRENGGPFDGLHFSEDRKNQFRFAALLHDIGKIGVPEALLTKKFRLSDEGMDVIRARGEYVKMLVQARTVPQPLSWQSPADVDADIEFLATLNSSGFVSDENFGKLQGIAGKIYFDAKGNRLPFVTDREYECLSVRKGNLTEKERERINSHAQATRRILSRIPWTSGLEQIPEIASHHHERLDGSGYPDGLKAGQLSFESKALAVIDIYEALVAQDRPYKPKMPPQKAFEILRAEANANHLDGTIVEFFISSGTYKIFLDEQTSDATPVQ
ncbi:MAG TPA: HD domain-containing phosphohydrolase [Chitinivibrionales bacterium]|nr:HD domain-containing phosphohydrolase [Chitinivibrionales bacterium]